MDTYAGVYQSDGNYTLVMRLRQNVIRAGLRNISVAYSRISLIDVASKVSPMTIRMYPNPNSSRLECAFSPPWWCWVNRGGWLMR